VLTLEDQVVVVQDMVIQTAKQLQVREQQAKDIQADGDIMAAQAQQVLTAHNLAPLSMVAVVVVEQEKKVFPVGVFMQMPKVVTV
jgi:hypothetical protein